jgi:hypothetical protein
MKKRFNEGNQIHNFMASSGSGTVINYGSGSDFLTSYGSGSGSTSQKVMVPTVPVPQHWMGDRQIFPKTRHEVSFKKGLSNEPTFGLIHLAGQYI